MGKWLLIGGDWDEFGGKSSKIIKELEGYLNDCIIPGSKGKESLMCFNGGYLRSLYWLMEKIDELKDLEVLLWFPKIDNAIEKGLLTVFKFKHRDKFLVMSKANYDNKYNIYELCNKMLGYKANLMLEFYTRENIESICMKLLDPLGNCFADTDERYGLSLALYERMKELREFTRKSIKENCNEPPIDLASGMDWDWYLGIVRRSAGIFTDMARKYVTDRFLGNSSFRCIYGFPSFRMKEYICVSERNVCKETISKDSFVLVNEDLEYYGRNKPSVDTPVQLELYKHFPNINYMLHGHCNFSWKVKDVVFTQNKVVPCGALEEVEEILKVIPENMRDGHVFKINLKGHGFLLMTSTLFELDMVVEKENFYERVLPYYVD